MPLLLSKEEATLPSSSLQLRFTMEEDEVMEEQEGDEDEDNNFFLKYFSKCGSVNEEYDP